MILLKEKFVLSESDYTLLKELFGGVNSINMASGIGSTEVTSRSIAATELKLAEFN